MGAYFGARAGWSGGTIAGLTPQRDIPYGDYLQRRSRYMLAESYYYNTIYDNLNGFAPYLKSDERLYKFIRGIVNPVQQENDLIVSYTYKGTVDQDNPKKGALPLKYDDRLEPAIKQVLKWSNLDQQLGTYVSNAALLGDAAWWVVDDPAKRRVRLELLDPARVKYVERDEVGNVKSAVIEYEKEEEPDVARYEPSKSGMELRKAKTYLYTLKVDQNKFQTFKDGEPFAFYNDADGNPVSEWDNIYGFVPLKLAYYTEGKDGWGRNSFFGTPRRQIDELNDQASLINDSIRNVVVPMLVAKGVASAAEISSTVADKDALRILYLSNPEGSIEPLSIPLDIGGASGNRDALERQLKANMPILSLADIREIGGNLSGTAIENMFGDAISVIENVRKNLDPAAAAVLQMALTMGGIQGYDGFQGITADSYDNGDLEITVANRAVIDDRLSKQERIQVFRDIKDMPTTIQRLTLEELDFGKDDIDEMLTELAAEKQANIAAAQQQQPPANGATSDPNAQADSERQMADVWAAIGLPSPQQAQAVAA